MDEPALRQLLDDVRAGVVAPDEAVRRLRRLPFADLGFARVDHHRPLRQGLAEAVYAPGKTPESIIAKLSAVLLKMADDPEIKEQMRKAGSSTVKSTPAQFRDQIAQEMAQWKPMVAEILAKLTPRDARRIGEAALARAIAQHTYERRVDLLELALEGGSA